MKNIDDKDLVDVTGGRANPGIRPAVELGGGQGGDEDDEDGTVGDDNEGGNTIPEG